MNPSKCVVSVTLLHEQRHMNYAELCSQEEYVILSQRAPELARDWLQERGIYPETYTQQRKPTMFDCDARKFLTDFCGRGRGSGYVYGRGSGIGSGIGRGRGRGFGYVYGRGSGSGIGSGLGIGCGSGIGSGIGRGRGYGISFNNNHKKHLKITRTIMKINKNYLIHVGDMHTVVGTVTEMICPGVWMLANASKVDIENQGDRWHELAANTNQELRQAARYWHYDGEVSVPHLLAVEWFGDLPYTFKASE
jgi:hypothetical protein